MNAPRILVVGRFSPFHLGHKALVDSFLKVGKKVLVAIRETEEKYPVSLRMMMIKKVYKTDNVKVISIPDIEGVAIGRDVGYYFVEVPEEIKMISGTKIRAGKSMDVPAEVKEILEFWESTGETLG